MDLSGNSSANGSAEIEPRGPGRPVGGGKPPGSGRRKGTPNRINKQVKELAGKFTERAVKRLWHLAQNAKSEETQLKATIELLAYGNGRPAQAVNLGGGEKPIGIARADLENAPPMELARRFELLASTLNLDGALAQALDCEPRQPPANGGGFLPTPKDFNPIDSRPKEPDPPDFEPLSSIADLQARDLLPRRGESCWLGGVEIRRLPGTRGDMFAVFANGKMVGSGGWLGIKVPLARLFDGREIPEPCYGPVHQNGISEPPPRGALKRCFERLKGGTR